MLTIKLVYMVMLEHCYWRRKCWTAILKYKSIRF